MRKLLLLILLSSINISYAQVEEAKDIATVMMKSTFYLYGPSLKKDSINMGTSFIMWYPASKDPDKQGPGDGKFALITADHVLKAIIGDTATIILRKEIVPNTFQAFNHKIRIRDKGKDLWYKHEEQDIAIISFEYVPGMYMRSYKYDMLASESMIDDVNLSPGDQLTCLGYSLGTNYNYAGFPVLRSGRIASFPISPTSLYSKMLFESHIYKGNSGGPVLFSSTSRWTKNNTIDYIGKQFIVGMIIEAFNPSSDNFELSVIITAPYIRAAIEKFGKLN